MSYRWRIAGRPAGAVAKIYDTNTSTPEFEADAPGQYLVSAKVIGAGGASSVDTTTVTVQADLPPIGAPFQSAADDRGTIELNGKPVANTTEPCDPGPDGLNCGGFGSYAVFNRVTLQLVTSGVFRPDKASGTDSMQTVADLADTYNTPPTYLMIVNFGPVGGDGNALAAGRRLVRTLGVNPMSDADMNYMLRNAFPKSIIGVPGSPAGSAFFSDPDLNRSSYHGRHAANMAGYLRLNPLSTTGTFEFVFTDQVEFDTDISQTPSVVTMKVGDQTYSRNVEGGVGGLSGFVLVELNSQTLAVQQTSVNFTNRPDGEQEPVGAKGLARSLERASANDNKHGQLLLLLQSFGRPKGTSTGWLEAAQAIEKLGGNAQVFAQLNQGFGEEPHQGRYAFVGRSSMDMPAAVSSQSLTGKAVDGKLHGLFARGRDDQYEPVIADPTGTINFELVRLVNRPSTASGGFPAFTPGEAAAATFLGRERDIMGVCEAGPAACDVRKAYYEKYTPADLWPTILNRLGSDFAKRKCDEPHVGFTAAECNDVREELELEVSRRNRVAAYFGPTGLQAPFLGGVGVAALVDIADIAAQIRTALNAPPTNNATATALDIIGLLTRIAGIGGLVKPPIGAIAAGVSGSFGLAGYLTRENGSPDLIGPKVTSAAASLGVDLFNRYQRASAYFTTEAKIVMSDWSKMSEVAAAVASNPRWVLGDVASSVESMRLGTKQAIYQSLIPVAFPVLYDLGTGVAHAKDWRCINPVPFTVNKNLFQRTGAGSELTWTLTSPPSLGVRHLLAVGAPHTVGNVGNAFIPAPPDSITGPLFRDPASPQGGIGLYKLDLYSPQRFRVFPEVLQQTTHGLGFGFYTCAKLPDPPGNSG